MRNKRVQTLEKKIKSNFKPLVLEEVGINPREHIDKIQEKYNEEVLRDLLYQRLSIILKEDNHEVQISINAGITLIEDNLKKHTIDRDEDFEELLLIDGYVSKFEYNLIKSGHIIGVGRNIEK